MNTSISTIEAGASRASRGWRISLWVLLALCVLALCAAFALIGQVDAAAPVEISVNGSDWVTDLDLAALPPAHKVLLAIGLAVALLASLVVASVGIVVALVALIPILLLSIALPVLIGGLLAALLLSPLLLLAWLLWRAVRPAPRSNTMAA